MIYAPIKVSIMIPVLLFVVPFAYGADITFYENHGFYIEYPAAWEPRHFWDSDPSRIVFKPDHAGMTGITVTLLDRYEIQNPHGSGQIRIDNVDQVDLIVEDLEDACRNNRLGACWNHELLDSKIVATGDAQAISIKYREVFEDEAKTTRLIFLPDGEKLWYVEAVLIGGSDAEFEILDQNTDFFRLVSETEPNHSPAVDHNMPVGRNYNVNLILVGADWSSSAIEFISDDLPDYIEPINIQTHERIGIRHTYSYNFASVPADGADGLAEFMEENSQQVPIFGSEHSPPVWQAQWAQQRPGEWVEYDRAGDPVFIADYRLVDALAVEEYIQEKLVGSRPDLSGPNSVNLVFLIMGPDKPGFLRNYYMESNDDATDQRFSSVGLMGYGGNYDMMFFDLYAAPWFDLDLAAGNYYFPPWVKSAHDCTTNVCLLDLVSFHAKATLQHVVTPPTLYQIQNSEKYVIDALVYTKPGQSNTITPSTLKYFIDEEKIVREFEYLYPFSDWDVRFSLERGDTRGLNYEFKKDLDDTRSFNFDNILGERTHIELLNSSNIQPHLLSWAIERKAKDPDPQSITIPVLVIVDSSSTVDSYLDGYGITGRASSMPNSTEPCCAFAVTSQKQIWNEKIGLTDLLIHEAGHAAGLMHPFMIQDHHEDIAVNGYFNWYSSPMTYSSPSSGCGLLYYLLFPDPCGNASLSFTEFERNMISDARLASLWQDTDSNLQKLNAAMSQNASKLLSDSKLAYSMGDLYSTRGSLALAIDAYKSSKILVEQTASDSIPSWAKSDARMWADGSAKDDTFLRLVRILLDMPLDANLETDKPHVPSWVKNNARWWADGLITDDEFIRGIEFLISHGAIKTG